MIHRLRILQPFPSMQDDEREEKEAWDENYEGKEWRRRKGDNEESNKWWHKWVWLNEIETRRILGKDQDLGKNKSDETKLNIIFIKIPVILCSVCTWWMSRNEWRRGGNRLILSRRGERRIHQSRCWEISFFIFIYFYDYSIRDKGRLNIDWVIGGKKG